MGSNAQIKAIKQVSGTLKIELANYRELQAFAQFGSDLDRNTKEILEHGEKVMELLKQPQYSPMDVYDQIIVLFSAKHRFIKKVPLNQIKIYQNELLNWMHKQYAHLIKDLQKLNYFDEKLEESFKQAIQQFTDQFIDE